jgi:uncharacterized protein (TIGR02145 family)
MKKTTSLLIFFIGLAGIGFGQTQKIGKQVWATKNLDVSTFRNGDAIREVKTSDEWLKAGYNKQPAWCYYNNDPENGKKYGKLYNWYAVKDSRGLAPQGWHIPKDDEWLVLATTLGGDRHMYDAGGKMKESGTLNWAAPNKGADNSSRWTGLPCGFRENDGTFKGIGFSGYWWAITEYSEHNGWSMNLYYNSRELEPGTPEKVCGFSVRCLKD